jgi:hypothetical protein
VKGLGAASNRDGRLRTMALPHREGIEPCRTPKSTTGQLPALAVTISRASWRLSDTILAFGLTFRPRNRPALSGGSPKRGWVGEPCPPRPAAAYVASTKRAQNRYCARERAAMARPACHPGARPPGGGWTVAMSTPLHASTHDTTEFEFHISPVSNSSRPQTGVGMHGNRSRTWRAKLTSSVNRTGLAIASCMSGMRPSRQRRIS